MDEIELNKFYFGDEGEIVLTTHFSNLDKPMSRVYFKLISDPENRWDVAENDTEWWWVPSFKERFKKAPRAYKTPLWKVLNG